MKFLTNEDLERIRIGKMNGRTAVLVYQLESTEQMYSRGEPTIADKLAMEFFRSFMIHHEYNKPPINDGYTPEKRYDALKSLRQ